MMPQVEPGNTNNKSASDNHCDYPRIRSHYIPRTRNGWIAVVAFLGLFALTQPPIVNTIVNRVTPWLFGLPFLYAYLLLIYIGLIGVLIWAQRRGV
ncbi:MAG TPA: hypothetical protein VIV14_01625 [Gammaproteobacteria bacterium]